jgi:hypothetical protein
MREQGVVDPNELSHSVSLMSVVVGSNLPFSLRNGGDVFRVYQAP